MKPDKAVALEYKEGIPKIIANIRGHLVKKLLEIATEKGITIYQDKDLTEVLSKLEKGSEIPEDLFAAVAEILAFCYNTNERFKEKMNGSTL